MRFEILVTETRDITLSRQRLTKAPIRLSECAGWSAPLLFAYDIRHVFSWPGSLVDICTQTGINLTKYHNSMPWKWYQSLSYRWVNVSQHLWQHLSSLMRKGSTASYGLRSFKQACAATQRGQRCSSLSASNWATAWQNQHCAPSQRVFAVHMKKPLVFCYPLSIQRRLIRLGGCLCRSESTLGTHVIVGFVMRRLSYIVCANSKGSCSSPEPSLFSYARSALFTWFGSFMFSVGRYNNFGF